MISNEKKKRYLDRANRNWRALRKEQEQFGYISDGGGKRYLAGIYYVLAGAEEKSRAYFSWFESEFPDDVGEPVFLLYWAILEHKSGTPEDARYRFHLAMLSNLYLIPQLIGKPIQEIDMWHSSNRDHPDYLLEVEDWLTDIPSEVIPWLEAEYGMEGASQLRWEYVETFHALQSARELSERQRLLQSWQHYAQERLNILSQSTPPLKTSNRFPPAKAGVLGLSPRFAK